MASKIDVAILGRSMCEIPLWLRIYESSWSFAAKTFVKQSIMLSEKNVLKNYDWGVGGGGG